MKKRFNLRQRMQANLETRSDAFLTLSLLAVVLVLVVIALLPGYRWLKAGALAWTILP